MSRAHLSRPIQDPLGSLIGEATIRLIEPGTGTSITEPIYVDDEGPVTRNNPWSVETGVLDFYLANPRRVDIGITTGGLGEIIVEDVDIVFAGDANDALIQSRIEDEDSLTRGALDKHYKYYFIPEDYGAVGDGITDDQVALQATFDAAYDAGGGVVLLNGRYGWTGDLRHRGAITVRGVSVSKVLITDDEMDRGLVALDATARYIYGQWVGEDVAFGDDNPGGLYDLVVDGAQVGGVTNGLFIWQGVDGYIQNCRIVHSAGDAVMIDGAQNATMEGCLVGNSVGKAFAFSRIDDLGQGAGSIHINNCYGATSGTLIYADSDPAHFWPHDILFNQCLFENYEQGDMLHLRAGEFQFSKCIFTNSNADVPPNDTLALIEQDLIPLIPTQVVFDGCYLNGTPGITHLVRTVTAPSGLGNLVRFYGKTYFNNGDFCIGLDGGGPFTSQVTIDGDGFRRGTIPDWYEAINGAWMFNVQRRTPMPVRWEMPTDPGGFLPDPISVKREGDTEDRYRLSRDGKQLWGNGTAPFTTQGSLEYVAASDEMQMGNRWTFMNAWSLRGLEEFITGVGQDVALSAAETSAPSALLVFQFDNASADIVLSDGETGTMYQIVLAADGVVDTVVNWPANVIFDGRSAQPPALGGYRIVTLTKVGDDWREVSRSGPPPILTDQSPFLTAANTTETLDCEAYRNHRIGWAAGGATTLAFSNPYPGAVLEISMHIGATAPTVTWPAAITWGAGRTAPATPINSVVVVTFRYDADIVSWIEVSRSSV